MGYRSKPSDIASVATHGVGHALGRTIARYKGRRCGRPPHRRRLSAHASGDDIDAVCTLYPSDGERPDPVMDPTPMQPEPATVSSVSPVVMYNAYRRFLRGRRYGCCAIECTQAI